LNKAALIEGIREKLLREFEHLRAASKRTREDGSDAESKAENKYDTRSTEENYLADGLAKQAQSAAQAAAAYEDLEIAAFEDGDGIDIGAAVELRFADATEWFFLGPAGGGIEVDCEGRTVTVVTPESPLGSQLLGLKKGGRTKGPEALVKEVC